MCSKKKPGELRIFGMLLQERRKSRIRRQVGIVPEERRIGPEDPADGRRELLEELLELLPRLPGVLALVDEDLRRGRLGGIGPLDRAPRRAAGRRASGRRPTAVRTRVASAERVRRRSEIIGKQAPHLPTTLRLEWAVNRPGIGDQGSGSASGFRPNRRGAPQDGPRTPDPRSLIAASPTAPSARSRSAAGPRAGTPRGRRARSADSPRGRRASPGR